MPEKFPAWFVKLLMAAVPILFCGSVTLAYACGQIANRVAEQERRITSYEYKMDKVVEKLGQVDGNIDALMKHFEVKGPKER